MSWRRPKLNVLGLVLAVFIAGGAAGAALDNIVFRDDGERRERRDHDHDDDRDRDGRRRYLDDLTLSPDQQIRIDSILERRRRETKQFWDTEGRLLRAIVDSAEAEVLRVLTPEQRVQLDSLRAKRRSRSDRR